MMRRLTEALARFGKHPARAQQLISHISVMFALFGKCNILHITTNSTPQGSYKPFCKLEDPPVPFPVSINFLIRYSSKRALKGFMETLSGAYWNQLVTVIMT